MLRTPKELFIASAYAGAWKKVAQDDSFEHALTSALSQLETEMPLECAVPQQACDAHQQMIGARKFMEILCLLHVPNTPPTSNKPKGLDYQAGI